MTDEQIFDIAEPFGAFEYGDAQGDKRLAYARAVEAAAIERFLNDSSQYLTNDATREAAIAAATAPLQERIAALDRLLAQTSGMNELQRMRIAELERNSDQDDETIQWQAAKIARLVPDGWKLMPDWKGYALLGTGHYIINHTADFDEKLGAELLITMATEDDKSGNRQIGESRDVTDPKLIESDQMVIRIGFLNKRGLFALEDQLRYIRQIHFSAAPAAPEQQDQSEQHLDMVAQAPNAQQAKAQEPNLTQIANDHGRRVGNIWHFDDLALSIFASKAIQSALAAKNGVNLK